MAYECNLCTPPKSHRSAGGLAGHQRLKHGMTAPDTAPPNSPPSRMAQELSELNNKVDEALDALQSLQEGAGSGVSMDQDGLAARIARSVSERLGDLGGRIDEKILAACREITDQQFHGLCSDPDCRPCADAKNAIRLDALARIESRLPGTKEALHQWEVDHAKGTIVNNSGSPASLEDVKAGLQEAIAPVAQQQGELHAKLIQSLFPTE